MCPFHILHILRSLLILQCTKQCHFHQSTENFEKIHIIKRHLIAADFLNTDNHHKFFVFPDSCHVSRIIWEKLTIYPHISIFQLRNSCLILTDPYRSRKLTSNFFRCNLQSSKLTVFSKGVHSNCMVLQHILHHMYRFYKKLLWKHRIKLSCNIKNLSKAVPAPHNLLLVRSLVIERILIHISHEQKLFLDQFIFIRNKFYIFFIFHPYISTDCSYCKIKDKRDPVGRFIEQCCPPYTFSFIGCQKRNRLKSCSRNPVVNSVQASKKHNKYKPQINHLKLRLISGKMIQKFEQEKSNDQFYYFYYWSVFIKPDFPAIDSPLLFSDRVQILIIDVGKIFQKRNLGKPAILKTYDFIIRWNFFNWDKSFILDPYTCIYLFYFLFQLPKSI